MKKGLAFLFTVILCFSVNVSAYEADLNVGVVGISSMDNYGFYFENTFTNKQYSLHEYTDLAVESGYTAEVEESAAALAIEATIGKRFLNNNLIGYSKFTLVPGLVYNADFTYPDNPYFPSYDGPWVSMKFTASIIYIGAGIKYQFLPMTNLSAYLAGDVGYMMISGNMEYMNYDPFSGEMVKYDDFSGSRSSGKIGFNIGGGAKYYFTDMFYANANAGFSALGMSFVATLGVGIDLAGNPTKASGGTSGGSGDAGAGEIGSVHPKAAKYEAYGDKLYAMGNYKKAFKYYSAAVKLDKNSVVVRKIGNCFNALGMTAKAQKYYNYADKLK